MPDKVDGLGGTLNVAGAVHLLLHASQRSGQDPSLRRANRCYYRAVKQQSLHSQFSRSQIGLRLAGQRAGWAKGKTGSNFSSANYAPFLSAMEQETINWMMPRHEHANGRRDLIHVPRQLIRDCAAVLEGHRLWKARPLRSIMKLIYCLNTLWERYPLIRYHRGFPQPAKCDRELRGLAGLCRRAARTGNAGPVLSRLLVLRRETSDSANLIKYQIARELRPDRPEAIVRDTVTDERLMALAASSPEHLAKICDDCAAIIAPLKATGRGGRRHEAELADRFVVESLGHYFEWLTKRRPTIPYKEDEKVRPRDRYYGPFFLLCHTVFAALGQSVSSRQVFDLLNSIDIPHWKIPEHLRQPWNPKKRKKKPPH